MSGEASTPSSDIPAPLSPNGPTLATLTPRVDALREKLVKDRMGSSARKERKKSLEGAGDAKSTIEGMLTARRMARKQQEDAILEGGIATPSSSGQSSGPPEWFTAYKTGMESRVSDLENQLEEKTDEVQALRERIEALEAGRGKKPVTGAPKTEGVTAVEQTSKVPKMVPGLSLGGGGEVKASPQQTALKPPTKIGSPKTRPSTAKDKESTSKPAMRF